MIVSCFMKQHIDRYQRRFPCSQIFLCEILEIFHVKRKGFFHAGEKLAISLVDPCVMAQEVSVSVSSTNENFVQMEQYHGWKLSFSSTRHWVSDFMKCSKKCTICTHSWKKFQDPSLGKLVGEC